MEIITGLTFVIFFSFLKDMWTLTSWKKYQVLALLVFVSRNLFIKKEGIIKIHQFLEFLLYPSSLFFLIIKVSLKFMKSFFNKVKNNTKFKNNHVYQYLVFFWTLLYFQEIYFTKYFAFLTEFFFFKMSGK